MPVSRLPRLRVGVDKSIFPAYRSTNPIVRSRTRDLLHRGYRQTLCKPRAGGTSEWGSFGQFRGAAGGLSESGPLGGGYADGGGEVRIRGQLRVRNRVNQDRDTPIPCPRRQR